MNRGLFGSALGSSQVRRSERPRKVRSRRRSGRQTKPDGVVVGRINKVLTNGYKNTFTAGHCSDSLIWLLCDLDIESDIASEYQSVNKSVASEGYANAGRLYRFRYRAGQGRQEEIHLTPKTKNIPTGLTAL
jgi:hypothetical protein